MGEFSDTALIAYPAFMPNGQPAPVDNFHCTILYFPDITDAGFTQEDLVDSIREIEANIYLWADVTGLELFGPTSEGLMVPVLTLAHDRLDGIHSDLISNLAAKGIAPDDRFPDYRPHVSVGAPGTEPNISYPLKVLLAPPQLWWRGKKVVVQ